MSTLAFILFLVALVLLIIGTGGIWVSGLTIAGLAALALSHGTYFDKFRS